MHIRYNNELSNYNKNKPENDAYCECFRSCNKEIQCSTKYCDWNYELSNSSIILLILSRCSSFENLT